MSPTPVTTRERLSSPLTWHYVGLGVMVLLVLGLALRLGMDWSATDSSSTDALFAKQIELKTLELQTEPLRGLEDRVKESRTHIRDFYATRIPANYSSIAVPVRRPGRQKRRSALTSGLLARNNDRRPYRNLARLRHQRRVPANHALCERP